MWWVVIVIFVCCLGISIGTFLLQYYGYCPVAAGLPLYDLHSTSRGCPRVKEAGLPASAILRLKSFSLASTDDKVSCTEECLICQDGLGERAVAQLPCEHIFHKSCISDWLLRKASCPMCRKAVTENDVPAEVLQPPVVELGMGEKQERSSSPPVVSSC